MIAVTRQQYFAFASPWYQVVLSAAVTSVSSSRSHEFLQVPRWNAAWATFSGPGIRSYFAVESWASSWWEQWLYWPETRIIRLPKVSGGHLSGHVMRVPLLPVRSFERSEVSRKKFLAKPVYTKVLTVTLATFSISSDSAIILWGITEIRRDTAHHL